MMLDKNELSNLINAQVSLVSSYLSIAAKNIEADTLMAQDYQMMAKEAAATVEILQRVILMDRLAVLDEKTVRNRLNIPFAVKYNFVEDDDAGGCTKLTNAD